MVAFGEVWDPCRAEKYWASTNSYSPSSEIAQEGRSIRAARFLTVLVLRRDIEMRVFASSLLMLCIFSSGCGSDPGPIATEEPTVPASGTVTFKGKPLPDFRVVLMPSDGRRPATGLTDADGKFVLGTNLPGDGAPVGLAKVGIVWAGPEQTGDVVDQSAIDDPSKMPKPPVNIPVKYNNPETSELTAEIPGSGTSDLKFELQ